MTMMMINE